VEAPLWHQSAAGVLFAGAYALIATDRFDKTKVALVGAVAMLLLGVVSQQDAFGHHERSLAAPAEFAREYAPPTPDAPSAPQVRDAADVLNRAGLRDVPGIDWNTILLLLGMMLYVGILGRTGALQWVAVRCAKVARGEPVRVMVLLAMVTGVISAGLDNVTTVLLVAPVTLLLCEALGVSPIPMLLAEVFASNIGGTATLIGDPPNIIIASATGYGFGAFIVHLTPIVVILLLGFAPYAAAVWRADLRTSEERRREVLALDERKTIRDLRLLRKCLAVGALILLGFALHSRMGWEPATVALAGAALLLAISRVPLEDALRGVEWNTLFFFAGLFIMVGGLVKVGLIQHMSEWVLAEFGANTLMLALVILWFSAFASALVDNIPYVATMCPLVNSLATAVTGLPAAEAAHDPRIAPIWWALALGACLGGNGTLIGASANVVTVGLAERSGVRISFREFTRHGMPVMLSTVAISTIYLLIRYL
jgi:Na+/H+ antiporter NhaD/arsenite permease-like protein